MHTTHKHQSSMVKQTRNDALPDHGNDDVRNQANQNQQEQLSENDDQQDVVKFNQRSAKEMPTKPFSASLIPIVEPKWKRTVSSTDVLPEAFSDDGFDGDDDKNNESLQKKRPLTSAVTKSREPLLWNRPVGGINKDEKENSSIDPLLTILCPTCGKNVVRYTCPRCDAPYCSAACYRVHDVPFSGEQSNSPNIGSGGRCTEEFYRDRVASFAKLEVAGEENSSVMRHMLNRALAQSRDVDETLDFEAGVAESQEDSMKEITNGPSAAGVTSDEDLAELAQIVLGIHDSDDDILNAWDRPEDDGDVNFTPESLPPHLRKAFERAVANGQLSHLIQPWMPWWVPDVLPTLDAMSGEGKTIENTIGLVSSLPSNSNQNKGIQEIEPMNEKSDATAVATIDERILNIPPFLSFQRKTVSSSSASKKSSSSSLPSPELQFNVLDILYATALTLRLYNGMLDPCGEDNASSSTSPFPRHPSNSVYAGTKTAIDDAPHTLLSASAVLNNDARFQCTAEAMTTCTSITTKGLLRHVVLPWTVLANDVSIISQSRRMVLRALFEAVDILRSGEPKRKGKKKKKDKHWNKTTSSDLDDFTANRETIRRARKKLDYYLSWSATNWTTDLGSNLANEVKQFMSDWRWKGVSTEDTILRDDDDPVMSHLISASVLTNKSDQARAKPEETAQPQNLSEPLLMEVRSSRRI